MDHTTTAEPAELLFDHAISESPASGSAARPAVVCLACHTAIETQYYDINGKPVCHRCREAIESAADTPRGVVPFVTASIFGLGAGIAGALLYYAVIAITHLEIGIVAILIGYMVGYSVRKGAHGRGGLRFQILAVALTYASVGFAYTPLLFYQEGGNIFSLALVLTGIAGPVLFIFGSFPSGLISAFIIFIGMRQAWRMTGAPRLQVRGPYTVGGAPASGTA